MSNDLLKDTLSIFAAEELAEVIAKEFKETDPTKGTYVVDYMEPFYNKLWDYIVEMKEEFYYDDYGV